MTEDTKKLFNAPWYVDIHAVDGFDGETYVFDGVYNDKCEPVCGNIQKHVTSNRLAHLPELYDALKQAVYDCCEDCLCALDEFNDGEYECDENGCVKYDLIEKGCVFKERDCCPKCRSWIDILRKVRDGK
jgi:hypothetical protein